MHSGTERWALLSLVVAMLLGVGGMTAIGISLIVGKDKTPEVLMSPISSSSWVTSTPSLPIASSTQTNSATVASTTNATATVTETTTPNATVTPPTTPVAVTPTATTPTQTPVASNTMVSLSPEEVAQQTQIATDALLASVPKEPITMSYDQARYDPIHFKPAIDKATNADCLKCHQEVLTTKVRDSSPAGLKKEAVLAWYQTLDTYQGEQMTFHQRHMTAPFINKVAKMQCTTCHQGNDLREETGTGSADGQGDLTMRKMVSPQVCLMCHGQFPNEIMGLPGPWHQSGSVFQNNCLLCHATIRTTRHQVNFLHPDVIEKEGAANSDTCYGCHGGRAWYRNSFPYPRHPWAGSGTTVPDWAKDRPTESDYRFVIQGTAPLPATSTKP